MKIRDTSRGIIAFLLTASIPTASSSEEPGPNRISLADGVIAVPGLPMGPFVRGTEGRILTFDTGQSLLSSSDDDGRTWGKPTVIARRKDGWIAYPYLFEVQPGQLWITTMQGGLRVKLSETDFLGLETN